MLINFYDNYILPLQFHLKCLSLVHTTHTRASGRPDPSPECKDHSQSPPVKNATVPLYTTILQKLHFFFNLNNLQVEEC